MKPFIDGEIKGRQGLAKLIETHRHRKDLRLSIATAYRRIAAYKASGDISAFLPDRAWRKASGSRIKATLQEQAMQEAIDRYYLCKKPLKISVIHDQYLPEICQALGCETPPYATLVRRVNEIKRRDPFAIEVAQNGRRAAEIKYRQNRGSHPLATEPLSCVQADYWDVHCITVDEHRRESVGRPVLCLATCITTMMPYGYYLSYEPPNAGFIGVTLFEGMIPKDRLLKRLGVEMDWPVWGSMKVLQLDNAKDFQGKMIQKFCDSRGIDLQHRPVRTPHFAGAIENRFKQLATKIDYLPGSTGSNHSKKRGNPAKEAVLTIAEFELILIELLREHIQKPVKKLGNISPLQAWNDFFFDRDTGKQIRALPIAPDDTETLRIELMPSFERTLTKEGLRLDHINYDSRELTQIKRSFSEGSSIKLKIRRDPRDVSYIYVLDPRTQTYIQVLWTERSREPVNLWQHRSVLRMNRRDGIPNTPVNQARTYEKRKAILSNASKKKAKARRDFAAARHGHRLAEEQNPKIFDDPLPRLLDAAMDESDDEPNDPAPTTDKPRLKFRL